MLHVTDRMLADAVNEIAEQGGRFDAHAVEKWLIRNRTIAFAEQLLEYRQSSDVLMTFSQQVGRAIDRAFGDQVRQAGRVASENLGGRVNDNMTWEKVAPQVTAKEVTPPEVE